MFSIFFEKYAKICRIALSFNHDSAADYIYSLFLHVIILWILCAKSVIIFWKSTILPKQALRQIPRNAVHRKLMIALLIIEKNRRLQKVRLKLRLRMRWRVRWRETMYLEPKKTLKTSSLSPCLQIKLNQVRPANKIHLNIHFSEYFSVFLQIYCANMGVEHCLSS